MKDDLSRPGDAQEVDINDADVSAETADPGVVTVGRRTAPPPLPPNMMAPPQQAMHTASQPPPTPSMPATTPSMTPPKPRSPMFFGMLVLAFVVVGVGGGAVVAFLARRAPSPQPASSAAPTATRSATVITIPVVEMDDRDSGP